MRAHPADPGSFGSRTSTRRARWPGPPTISSERWKHSRSRGMAQSSIKARAASSTKRLRAALAASRAARFSVAALAASCAPTARASLRPTPEPAGAERITSVRPPCACAWTTGRRTRSSTASRVRSRRVWPKDGRLRDPPARRPPGLPSRCRDRRRGPGRHEGGARRRPARFHRRASPSAGRPRPCVAGLPARSRRRRRPTVRSSRSKRAPCRSARPSPPRRRRKSCGCSARTCRSSCSGAPPRELWAWAVANWRIDVLRGRRTLRVLGLGRVGRTGLE